MLGGSSNGRYQYEAPGCESSQYMTPGGGGWRVSPVRHQCLAVVDEARVMVLRVQSEGGVSSARFCVTYVVLKPESLPQNMSSLTAARAIDASREG